MHVRDILSRAGGPTFLAGLALILTTLGPREARAQQPDPVQALDRALLQPTPYTDPKDKDKAVAERKQQLTKLTDQLTSMGEMAQALLLTNWGDVRVPLVDVVDTSSADRDVREALLRRFLATAKKSIEAGNVGGDPLMREAVATVIGEFSASARSGTLSSRANNKLLIDKLPEVAETLAALGKKDSSPEVRAAAARSLAKLRGAPDVTVGALESMLQDGDPGVRRAAAGALADLLRGSPAASRTGVPGSVEPPSREEVIQFGPRVARVAGAVLSGRERDPEVRRLCAAALLQVAQVLGGQIHLPSTEAAAEVRGALRPVVKALWDQTGALTATTQDANPGVRQEALRALEEMGEVRRRWLHPEEFLEPGTLPITPGVRPPARPLNGELLPPPDGVSEVSFIRVAEQQPAPPRDEPAALGAAIPALARNLGAPDVRTRLTAIDALETITGHGGERTVAQELGKQPAAEAARALTRALYDRDRYVRWAAARTLGKMAPLDDVENGKQVEQGAVGGLARLLSDPDPDLRLRVAWALERFGKAAGDAVPALAVAASRGDEEARIGATNAIQVIGGHADEAVPALAAGLASDNVRLRRASAEALGKYGAQARAARPALQQAMRDPDAEVRRLAAEAIVKIGTVK